jgi:hypothetical protein
MAKNPIRPALNRANQIKAETGDLKHSISLFDVDYAMMSYLEDVALPTLEEGDGNLVKIPVVYGNSERWNGARREGIYRDIKGKIQLPIMMIRRTSIASNDAIPMFNNHVSYATVSRFNKNNRYDRFTILNNTQPSYELHTISMPKYVDINYDCMVWTSFTEHSNHVIEKLTYTTDYWGDKDKFKFKTSIADFNVINEVGEGSERINRVEFTLNVKAYLLPEKWDGEATTKKSFSTKKVFVSTETDVTSGTGRLEGLLTTPSAYYDNKDLVDFLALNNSKSQKPISIDTITFSNIKLIKAPEQLASVVTSGIIIGPTSYDIKVYINGVRYYQTNFNVSITSNSLTINFIPTNIGFNITPEDEIAISGKFIDIV